MRKFLILLVAVMLFGCKKNNDQDCAPLRNALFAGDDGKVRRLINEMIPKFDRQVAGLDEEGFKSHFSILVDKLNSCDLQVMHACYSCIDTNPPTSEISIVVKVGNDQVTRIIDLAPDPERKRFEYKAMH